MNIYKRRDEYFESEEEGAYWEQISNLETSISCWFDNEIEDGNIPAFENFLEEYPEWDHETLYDTIIASITRFTKMNDDEKQWDSLPF